MMYSEVAGKAQRTKIKAVWYGGLYDERLLHAYVSAFRQGRIVCLPWVQSAGHFIQSTCSTREQ